MIPTPRLIGLYSPAPQSGKTTAATFLHNLGYTTVSFAAPLKRMATVLLQSFGYPEEEAWHYATFDKQSVVPELGYPTRYLLQTLGTEWGRTYLGSNIWLSCFEAAVQRHFDNGRAVVADDVRFPNEAALIRKLGGEMWCLTRPGVVNTGTHSSEGALDNYPHFDRRITNSGDLKHLYVQVRDLVQSPLTAHV